MSRNAIQHRLRRGRLHTVRRGVYAVGRAELTHLGEWMAAVLSCGPGAVLSHETAAQLWEIRRKAHHRPEVSVASARNQRVRGVVVHRRKRLEAADVRRHAGIPVTTPLRTLIDLATRLPRGELERAIREADKRDLADPERLRLDLDSRRGRGVAALRTTLDRHTFALTDSELERLFLAIAKRAGLDRPLTQQLLNGFRVDFYWPDLGLVVETDGLRYHRTPTQQTADRLRDQKHATAGLTPLRFTHSQVAFEPSDVEATLQAVATRLARAARAAR